MPATVGLRRRENETGRDAFCELAKCGRNTLFSISFGLVSACPTSEGEP